MKKDGKNRKNGHSQKNVCTVDHFAKRLLDRPILFRISGKLRDTSFPKLQIQTVLQSKFGNQSREKRVKNANYQGLLPI